MSRLILAAALLAAASSSYARTVQVGLVGNDCALFDLDQITLDMVAAGHPLVDMQCGGSPARFLVNLQDSSTATQADLRALILGATTRAQKRVQERALEDRLLSGTASAEEKDEILRRLLLRMRR